MGSFILKFYSRGKADGDIFMFSVAKNFSKMVKKYQADNSDLTNCCGMEIDYD